MSVLSELQYKQCLCNLTLQKCNPQFLDKIYTIYKPGKILKSCKQYEPNFS